MVNRLLAFWLGHQAIVLALVVAHAGELVRTALGGPSPADAALLLCWSAALSLVLALVELGGSLVLARLAGERVLWGVLAFVGALLTWLTWVDLRVYLLLGVHLYGRAVTATLENAHLNQEWNLGASAVATGVLAFVGLLALHLALAYAAARWRWPRLLRAAAIAAGVFVAAVLVFSPRLLSASSPLATALPLRELTLGGRLRREPLQIVYPPPGPAPVVRRPRNVLVLAIESLRSDAVADMPQLQRFAREHACLEPRRHFAGGHETEQGIFSLLYGLDAYRFLPFRDHATRSWPLEILRRGGYQLAGGSASGLEQWNGSGFITAQLEPYLELSGGSSDERDRKLLGWAEEWHRTVRGPWFLFLFLDSTHVSYSYPMEFEFHRPVARDDFALHAYGRGDRTTIVNRYRNATAWVDELVMRAWRMVAADYERGDLVLVVTGDHGEEFWERGLFGHTAPRFNKERTQVPLLICARGMTPPSVELSAGADVLPTVLDLLGVESDVGDGVSLLRPRPDPMIPISAAGFPVWDRQLALVTPGRKLRLLADPRFVDHYIVAGTTDLDDQPLPPPPAPEAAGELERFTHRFARFLR